jgi:hypothetical protein
MKLPRLSRADRLMLGILLPLALVAALVTWVLMPPEQKGGFPRQPSTFYNVGYGTKAAYRVLERLDYRVQRLRRPISDVHLQGIAALVLLKPTVGLTDAELSTLKRWTEQGHRLVVAPGASAFRLQPGNFLEQWFKTTKSDGGPVRVTSRGQAPPTGQDELLEGFDPDEPLCKGIAELTAGGKMRFAEGESVQGDLANAPVREFWKDAGGIVALRIEYGSGEIVALADPYPLTNLGIGEADNALFLANLARTLAGPEQGVIAFDEYHLGFPQRDYSWVAMAKLMLSGNWRWAVLQGALVGALALWAAGVRFGSPRDVQQRRRRQHQEFADAAGRLLFESGAVAIAHQTLFHHYRNRLCRLVRRGPETADAQLAEAVREAGGGEIGSVLQAGAGHDRQPVSQHELLAMCRTLHRAVEALELHNFERSSHPSPRAGRGEGATSQTSQKPD